MVWNRKQKAISAVCGMIGAVSGLFISTFPFFGSWVVGVVFVCWGLYYYVKGMW